MGIYQILYTPDCSPRLFDSPDSPDHSVYTAKIIYAHHSNRFAQFAGIVAMFPWSVARTEHKYWGLYGWNQRFTILPYREFNVGEEYLIAGYIRPSLIGHLLNLMDTYCSRVTPVSESALELHLLQSMPTHDGARLVGQILKEDSAGKREPIPHLAVNLVLHHGPQIIALTDAQGIFDYPKIGPGEYDIYLRSLPATAKVEDIRRCSSGFLREGAITDCTLVIPASSLPQ
jgi:hypothetical protein